MESGPWRGVEKCVQLRENQEQAVTSHLPASDVVLFSSGNGMGCIIIGSGCTASKLSSMSEPRTSCPNSQIGDNIVNCPILSVHFKDIISQRVWYTKCSYRQVFEIRAKFNYITDDINMVSLSAIKNKIDRIFNITLKKTEKKLKDWFCHAFGDLHCINNLHCMNGMKL